MKNGITSHYQPDGDAGAARASVKRTGRVRRDVASSSAPGTSDARAPAVLADDGPLTPAERRLGLVLRVLSIVFLGGVFGYLLPALVGPWRGFFVNLPFVTNSVVKIGALSLLAFLAAADVRRHRAMVSVILLAHLLSLVSVGLVLWLGDADQRVVLGGRELPISVVLWASVVLDTPITLLLYWAARTADRSREALRYLSPVEFRTAVAVAEVVVVGEDEAVPALDVARNVDRYLGMMRARNKWTAKAALFALQYYPLLSFRAPLSHLRPDERLAFLRSRFYEAVSMRLVPSFWRVWVQAVIRFGKQLAYLGYYNDPRSYPSVGYVPMSERAPAGTSLPDYQRQLAERRQRNRQALSVRTPAEVRGERLAGDVVIVGSGAAASVLAHQLTRAGKNVLLLERGQFVDRAQFTEDEAEMLTKLYSDGALQLSKDFRFQVIQGSCVGGSTVVNNAVCFDLPRDVCTRWNGAEHDAGLDEAELYRSFEAVRQLIRVQRQPAATLNPGAVVFEEGVARLGLGASPNEHAAVDANIRDCLGCGYCNIGCQFGAKLSMLDHVLPEAQRHAASGGGRLEIASECEALKLLGRGRRITGVRCRLGDGRLVDVHAGTVIVSAGAIGSSALLLRSGVGEHVGERLAFNIGSPITALYPKKLDSFAGLQISHYLVPRPQASHGFVLETWWNPPASQALAMPGWFEDHFRMMRRYDRMTGAGVLVGSQGNGRVKRALGGGTSIDFVPARADLDRLLQGLTSAAEIFLAGGAEAVFPHTFDFHELRSSADVRRLPELVRDASDITLGTGHPQGGNALSRNPGLGAVNEEFCVPGYDNLYVCDASVFPTSIGVNPQLTVMALAHYAAPRIAARMGGQA
jgi:choline dehydrogenase-like flavoprotein